MIFQKTGTPIAMYRASNGKRFNTARAVSRSITPGVPVTTLCVRSGGIDQRLLHAMCDLGCDETGTAYGHGKVPKGQGCPGKDATPSGANFAAPPLATWHTKRSGGYAVNMRAFSWQCMDLMASWAFEPLDHSREFSQVDVRECSLDPSVPCVPWAGFSGPLFCAPARCRASAKGDKPGKRRAHHEALDRRGDQKPGRRVQLCYPVRIRLHGIHPLSA